MIVRAGTEGEALRTAVQADGNSDLSPDNKIGAY